MFSFESAEDSTIEEGAYILAHSTTGLQFPHRHLIISKPLSHLPSHGIGFVTSRDPNGIYSPQVNLPKISQTRSRITLPSRIALPPSRIASTFTASQDPK
jgi:hypothetical protein